MVDIQITVEHIDELIEALQQARALWDG